VVVGEQMRGELFKLQTRVSAEKVSNSAHTLLGVAQERIDLQPVAGAEDRSLKHIVAGAKALKGVLHRLLSDAEPLPDLHRGRAVTEADDGDVHGGRSGL